MSVSEPLPFGLLLKQLRKRAGMTQRDLGAALNYSNSLISSLEKAQRQPDLDAVITRFIPALGLQNDPAAAAHLIERAAAARGELAPGSPLGPVTLRSPKRVVGQESSNEYPTRLPLPPTALIGRKEEVNQLCYRLLGHSGRLLTLVGPPGIGKTRMALAMAMHLQHHYVDGAVFVALAEITDPELVASAILDAVGSNDARPKSPKIKLVEALRRKSMLLVLDNCEQIRDAAPLVADLLSSCADVVVLATSRERLHLRAEQRYQVPPLELEAAVDLFTQRAAAVNARFVLTDLNRPTIAAICERLDCLPLALELCAAQTDLHSLPQLLAQLHNRRLDLLVDGANDLPMQQRTLRRAIQRSYGLLSDEERTLFRSLGIFVGGFDLEMLDLVSVSRLEAGTRWEPAALHSTLHALIGKSLVRADTASGDKQRFLLLEMLREFALEQLRAQGEEAEMRLHHYHACLQLFRTGDTYLRGSEFATWMARLQPEEDNLRAAFQWALDEARYTDMAWLLLAAHYFWELNGHGYERARWFLQVLPYRQLLAIDLRLATLILFLSTVEDLEEFQSADLYAPYAAEMFELLEICPYKQLHANAWFSFAWIAPDGAHTANALARAITLAEEAGEGPSLGPEFCMFVDDDFTFADMQAGYGAFLGDEGEVEQSTMLIKESLLRFRRRGNLIKAGTCRALLGVLALLQGDMAEAHTCFKEVVAIGIAYSLPMMLAEWHPYLGLIALYGGNSSEARQLLEESLRLCLEVKNTIYLNRACICLAELSLWEEDADEAAYWVGQSLSYFSAPKRINIHELQRFFVAARLATMQGQYLRAAALLGIVEAAHRRIHYVNTGPMLSLVSAARAQVREALGVELFDQLFAAGQQLSLDEAYTTLLAPTHLQTQLTFLAP